MIRAKFIVESHLLRKDGGEVILRPVSSGSEDNKEFYKWTPSGEIKLSTVNESVLDELTIDKEFYVDFTEAK